MSRQPLRCCPAKGILPPMDVLPLLDRIQAIARTGLTYASNSYDRERYEELLELASRSYGGAFDAPPDGMRERLTIQLGFVTPKVGADAASSTTRAASC